MNAIPFAPAWESLRNYRIPAWFENAKFGIFAHWGPQCHAELGDWYARLLYDEGGRLYREHCRRFGHPSEFGFKDVLRDWKAERWNPDELSALFRRMGARYVVAMANHHDNVDLWDSLHQPWNSVNFGPKRDIMADWRKAILAHGMRFGASIHAAHAWHWYETSVRADRDGPKKGIPYDGTLNAADGKGTWWEGYDPQDLYAQNHPLSRNSDDIGYIHQQWGWENGITPPSDRFRRNVRDRVNDLVDRYHPDLLYFDDTVLPFHPIADEGLEIAAHFYNANAARHGGDNQAVMTGKILSEDQRKAMVWDMEMGVPPGSVSPHWQTDLCLGGWHYNRENYEKDEYRTAANVLQFLVDIVSKNGNLLLSVPIRGDGTIDEKERAICDDIAAWTAVNGEAIFDATAWRTCGEGPQLEKAPPLHAQGFNLGGILPPTGRDIRYTAKGNVVYAFTLLPPPDGEPPVFAALDGADIVEKTRLPQVKDFPAVYRFVLST